MALEAGLRKVRHHLVVLHEQYLKLMLSGRKRIECRLSTLRRPPFEAVSPGDLLWLKLPSQPVHAVAVVRNCIFRELRGAGDLQELLRQRENQICAQAGFYQDAATWARFASLIWVQAVLSISPMPVRKTDQRAWVVLDRRPWPGMRVSGQVDHSPVGASSS